MVQWEFLLNHLKDLAGKAARPAALGVWACLALTGCEPAPVGQRGALANLFRPERPLAVSTAPADPDLSIATPAGRLRPAIALQLSFDVLRTQVPRGTFSESGKIWNHVDEQVIPADLAANLQRNGLRIARGKANAWPPIKALLDAEKDITVWQNAMTVGNGLPLTIELDTHRRDQTLFLFRHDGTLGGVTLPDSMNLLRIEYAIPVTDPDAVILNVMPEIRLQPPEPKLTLNGWTDRPLAPPSRVFRELAAQVQVGPDEFLALGPAPAAHRAHTMGALLLGREDQGREYECMLFVTPRVIRKELPWAGNAQAEEPAAPPVSR